MIIWGLLCTFVLLAVLTSGSLAYFVVLVLPSAIVLHSYAALKLQKSIRNPAVPLNSQTPTGIRFIGFVALFIGISNLISGFSIIQNSREFLQQVQSQMTPEMKQLHFTEAHMRAVGIITLLVGLCVSVNVVLNLRLLKWYILSRNNTNIP
jgi:hypothetical protein